MNDPSQLAARIQRAKEPSKLAWDVAERIDRCNRIVPVRELARAIDAELTEYDRRYQAMETAVDYLIQLAKVQGAPEECLRKVSEILSKSVDKEAATQ